MSDLGISSKADFFTPSDEEDFFTPSDEEIDTLVQSINRTGFAVIPDYIDESKVRELYAFVQNAVRSAGNSYVSFTGHDAVTGTMLERMAKSASFRSLCARIYERESGLPAPDEPYYQLLRCLTGELGQRHSYRFHFDTYVLTVLLPIHVPEGKYSGDLIVLPNVRSVRSWYALNLLDKILVDNPISQKFLRWTNKSGSRHLTRIKMKPGNLYLFWGYRTLHTNEPCDPEKIRATALFHYVDPHADSRLKQMLRA